MSNARLSPGARALAGERLCQLHLRQVGDIPGGLWSWRVYVDGNAHGRGPGSTRKDATPWYASLGDGPHRVVLRQGRGDESVESNTLEFLVRGETSIVIEVRPCPSGVVLSLAPET